MDHLSKELIDLLQFLLPGLLATWVYHSLTTYSVPAQFERVIQALIFTLIVGATSFSEYVVFVKWMHFAPVASENGKLFVSTINALFVGFVFAAGANNDLFHSACRKFLITTETSYPSEWFGTFACNVTYIVLHMTGERRLYGWPKEWPSAPDKGHFFIEDASWLKEDGTQVPLSDVTGVLVCAKDVEFVEFMRDTWSANNGS